MLKVFESVRRMSVIVPLVLMVLVASVSSPSVLNSAEPRTYHNTLTPLGNQPPLLADFPQFVQPIVEPDRFEAPVLIDDDEADLEVRAWRYSYNARGIIEIPNRLRASRTAVLVVHPWGIDDGQGWQTPEPAGVAFAGTFDKNQLMLRHARETINPLLKRLRKSAGLVGYSLPGREDAIRGKLYRSVHGRPTDEERREGTAALTEALASFNYRAGPIPEVIELSSGRPAIDYFRQFPGVDAGPGYNRDGFWNLPIPVMKAIDTAPDDVVFYDGDGYSALRDFLLAQRIEHVILCGYHADMCVCSTTAGFENLRRDFNVFLVGDAVQATLPANRDSRFATNQSVSYAALNLLITQTSWIKSRNAAQAAP
ncbi:MAG: isochorismatase family protein [Planctomycetales bacterium]